MKKLITVCQVVVIVAVLSAFLGGSAWERKRRYQQNIRFRESWNRRFATATGRDVYEPYRATSRAKN